VSVMNTQFQTAASKGWFSRLEVGPGLKYCYVLEWCLLSDITLQTVGLFATPHNTTVQHYYVRDKVHVERRFL
jgi:hypothetical protein